MSEQEPQEKKREIITEGPVTRCKEYRILDSFVEGRAHMIIDAEYTEADVRVKITRLSDYPPLTYINTTKEPPATINTRKVRELRDVLNKVLHDAGCCCDESGR